MNESNKRNRFGLFMLVYALLFLVFIGAGMLVLHRYLQAYEKASAPAAVQRWIEELDDEKSFRLAEPSLERFDNRICPTEEIFIRYVTPWLGEDLHALRDHSASKGEHEHWLLVSGDQLVGELELKQGEKEAWGLCPWQVCSEKLDFSFLPMESELSVTVPEGFHVECGGFLLDESFVTERCKACPELAYLAGTPLEPPELVCYTVKDRIGDTPLRISDEEGKEYPADTDFEQFLRERILNSCSEEEKAALADFAERYCEAYVAFMGCRRDNVAGGYRAILPFLLEGSDLAARMANARNGQLWSHNRKNEVVSIEHRSCIRLDEGEYICDFCFVVDTLGLNGTTRSENNTRLYVCKKDGVLYASDMIRY